MYLPLPSNFRFSFHKFSPYVCFSSSITTVISAIPFVPKRSRTLNTVLIIVLVFRSHYDTNTFLEWNWSRFHTICLIILMFLMSKIMKIFSLKFLLYTIWLIILFVFWKYWTLLHYRWLGPMGIYNDQSEHNRNFLW